MKFEMVQLPGTEEKTSTKFVHAGASISIGDRLKERSTEREFIVAGVNKRGFRLAPVRSLVQTQTKKAFGAFINLTERQKIRRHRAQAESVTTVT